MTGLARTLRADFAAVEAQFTLVNDPTGDIARAMMGLVYDAAATDFFFGLLNNALTTSVDYASPLPALAQPILDASSARLSYDDLRKHLSYSGVLDAATFAAIQAAVTANGDDPAASGRAKCPIGREPQGGQSVLRRLSGAAPALHGLRRLERVPTGQAHGLAGRLSARPQAEAQAGASAGRPDVGRGDRPQPCDGAPAGCYRPSGSQRGRGRRWRFDGPRSTRAVGALFPLEQHGGCP